MGLLTVLRKLRQKEKEIRILLVGLDNAGKSTILYAYQHQQERKELADQLTKLNFDHISPTLGFQIKSIQHRDGYLLNVWDVGGQKSIRPYWKNHYSQTDALIFVIDSADVKRMNTNENSIELPDASSEHVGMEVALDVLNALKQLLFDERTGGATLLILANKADLDGAKSVQEISQILRLNEWIQGRHWRVMSCSAYTGAGIKDGFDWLVQDVASRLYLTAPNTAAHS